MVTHGNTPLMLQDKASMVAEYPVLNDQNVGAGFTLFVEVADIETLYQKLQDKVTIVKALGMTDYGMSEFAITDCNGVVLTFAQRQ